MKESSDLFKSIIIKDNPKDVFKDVMSNKIQTAVDVKRVSLAADIFGGKKLDSVVEEEIEIKEDIATDIASGKSLDNTVTSGEFEKALGKIYDNTGLTKSMIKLDSYKKGESNPKKKNPYQKNSINFHLYELGQQVELSRL